MELLQPLSSLVGVASGIAGLVLGILNFVHQRDATTPKLRVRPKILDLIDRGSRSVEKNVAIMEVSNVGRVPVIGSTIGFRARRKGKQGYIVLSPDSVNGVNWPGELRPGHVVLLRMKLEALPTRDDLGPAFAKTILDDIFTATRRDMKTFRDDLAKSREAAGTLPLSAPSRTAA